jgi:maltose-binding protein MalE
MTSQPASQIYTDEAGHVPVRDDVSSSSELVNAFAAASASGFPRPQSSEFGSFWGPFGDMFTKVIEGESTSADGVAEACTAMNEANGK